MKHIYACLLFTLLYSNAALAVNNANFWLPSSYREWLPDMREQAEALERDEADCKTVIKATLHESRSTKANPVFRFVCRDAQHKSYSIIVDAVSGQRTYSNPMRSPEYRAKKEEEQRLAKLAAAKERLKHKQVDCEHELSKKTRFMRDFAWVSEQFMAPQRMLLAEVEPAKGKKKQSSKKTTKSKAASDSSAKEDTGSETPEEAQVWVFDGHFDAKDVQGRPLKYQARCIVYDDKEAVTIKIARRQSAALQSSSTSAGPS